MNILVIHYPPYCSKYNPIEHRMFAPITRSWSGVPTKKDGKNHQSVTFCYNYLISRMIRLVTGDFYLSLSVTVCHCQGYNLQTSVLFT